MDSHITIGYDWIPLLYILYTMAGMCVYIPGKPYGHFFLSIMGFTRNGRFFCSIAYFGF